MGRTITGPRARGAAIAVVLALSATLIPLASVFAAAVAPASGGSAISADQFGTANFTTLTGPAIAEAAIGELALGTTTILNVPAGFRFNPGAGNTSVAGAGCTLAGSLSVTATQATFTVTTASTVAGCILTFVGLQVQPTAGPGLTTGNITKTGTSAAPGGVTNYGTLTKVAGAVTELIYLTQPSANNNGGTAFGTQPIIRARDQFGNNAATVPVTLAIAPGTGATGATLTCTTNPVNTNAGGNADFVASGCKIDLAGTYRLRASNGAVFVDSGNFNVNVGPASKLVFKGYPAATTPPLLTPQPLVAITDAGGNTVTAFAATPITLAINKAAGTFTCTGGLTTNTVNGVATFAGCTETVADTGYALTATAGFANTTGPNFAVTPPTLAFIAGPGAPTVGQPFPTNVQVAIQNGGATLTTGIAATVTLALGTNPTAAILTCTGGPAVGTISGVATFTGCSIDKVGTGYTLTATASNIVPPQTITPATSTPFNVTLSTTPAVITLTTFCGTPQPISTTGTNQCPLNGSTPPQANIKLPQTSSEGVWLRAHIATNGANRAVTFEVSKDQTTWSTINAATTDGSGNAAFFYRPSDNRYYRVSFAGSGDLGAAMSPIVRVVVRQLVFIRPTGCTNSGNPCDISRGRTITFTAIARPNRPELPTQQATFTVQHKSGGTFVTVSTQTVVVSKSTGEANLAVTFSSTGTYRIRVNLAPTPVNANSFPTPFEYYSVS